MSTRRILIVGPSGSGKTATAESVARELGLPLISMDDFRARRQGGYPIVIHNGQRVRNYEAFQLWDGHAIACKLSAFIAAGSGFVAEGNHLLCYPAIAAIPDCERYYIDVPFSVSVERRKTRHRFLPADESFALIGEEQTRLNVVPQLDMPGVRRLDGTRIRQVCATEIISRVFVTPIIPTREVFEAMADEQQADYADYVRRCGGVPVSTIKP